MRFELTFQTSRQTLPVEFGAIQTVTAAPDVEIYAGAYEVVPKAEEAQQLPTAQKYLTKNVNVSKIPYYEIDNAAGGTTVYIGTEDELIVE